MARIVYCRWPACRKPTTVTQPSLPDTCPECKNGARWSVVPPDVQPRRRYVLTVNDRRFLRSLRIAGDDAPLDDPDDDGA